MKSSSWTAVFIVSLLAVMLVSSGLSAAALELPKWPQSFSVGASERASFAFPVLQPGHVQVDVGWTGGQLEVYLVDPAGKAITPTGAKNSPVAISYSVTAADVAKGFIWKVVVADLRKPITGKAARPVLITGQITAQYPPVDAAKVAQLAATLSTRNKAAITSDLDKLTRQAQATHKAALAKAELADKNAFTAQDTQLAARVKAELDQSNKAFSAAEAKLLASVAIAPAGSSIILPKGPTVAGTTINLRDMPKPIEVPQITYVSPPSGYAGDSIFVYAEKATADANLNEVWFTIAANTTIKGQITKVTPEAGKVRFDVIVPEEAPNMRADFSGNVCLKVKDASGTTVAVTSNLFPFTMNVRLRPVIDSIVPNSAKPGIDLEINGKNFSLGCRTHFVFPDGRDEFQSNSDDSTLRIRPYMALYTSHTAVPVAIYVEKNVKNRWIRSEAKTVTALATESGLTAVSPTEGVPGQPLYITGYGLLQVNSIVFEPDPGQESLIFTADNAPQESCRHPWTAKSGISDTAMHVNVNPVIRGIAAPIRGKLYGMYGGKKTNGLPFTLNPKIIEKPIFEQYSVRDTIFQQKDSADVFTQPWSPSTYDMTRPPIWISGHHSSSIIFGHSGDDTFYMDVSFKNNWRLERIDFDSWLCNDSHGARLHNWYLGTDGRPTAVVHWWVDAPINTAFYDISVYAKGPAGVPYK